LYLCDIGEIHELEEIPLEARIVRKLSLVVCDFSAGYFIPQSGDYKSALFVDTIVQGIT
jgi:hypothetical protein